MKAQLYIKYSYLIQIMKWFQVIILFNNDLFAQLYGLKELMIILNNNYSFNYLVLIQIIYGYIASNIPIKYK